VTAVYIIAGLLILFVLIVQIRIRIRVDFGEKTSLKISIAGRNLPLHYEKKPSEAREKTPADKADHKEKPRGRFTVDDVMSLLEAVKKGFRRMLPKARRRVRIEPFSLCVITGGDPADAARLYGYLNSVVFTLMPQLEQKFRIPDPKIHLDMDYSADHTVVSGTLGLRLRLADVLAITFSMTGPLLMWFIRWNKKKSAPNCANDMNHNNEHSAVACGQKG